MLNPVKFFGVVSNTIFLAFWTVGAAFAATLLFSPFVRPVASPLFLIAVMVSAWRGGLWAGFLATVLSAAASLLFFLPSDFSFELQREEISQFLIDVLASVIIGTLSAKRRRAENERIKLLELEKNARIEAEQANEFKDEFLATVSHELRTPLTTIKTLTHFLRHKNPTAAERDEYLSDIASECERQIDLVHNLLDLSRIRAAGVEINLSSTDVGAVLNECVKIEHIEAAARNHRLIVEVAEDLPPASADANALRRAVCTMLENSIKYTPDGGTVRLRANLTKTGSSKNDKIKIDVTDDGRGIHPQDLPHIFESFYRGHLLKTEDVYTLADEQEVKGIGLGLHLAKFLVEGMQGEISVQSTVGAGSTFTITLNAWRETSGD